MIIKLRQFLFHFSLRHPNFAAVVRRCSYHFWRMSLFFRVQSKFAPDTLLYVNPEDIKAYLGGKAGNRFYSRGKVKDGDWDLDSGKFTGWDIHQAIHDHYLRNVPWSKTRYYKRALEHLKHDKLLRGENDIDAIFKRIENLHDSILANGLKSMKEWPEVDGAH